MKRRRFLKTLASAVVLGFTNCVPCWGQEERDCGVYGFRGAPLRPDDITVPLVFVRA